MNSILSLNNIRLHQDLKTQEEVFLAISDIAFSNHIATSKEKVVKGLFQREEESTTGFMDGFAIPHTKSSAVKQASVIVLSLKEGIEWESMDGKPASFIIALLIPEVEGKTTHLALLSSISRMLMHSDVRERLLSAKSESEVLEELDSAISVSA